MAKIWWIRSDPCGIFSASLTVVLVLYAQFVVVRVLLLPWYGVCPHIIFYTLCSILSIVSHCRAQFMDPGAVPKNPASMPPKQEPGTPPIKGVRLCKRCNTVKPYNAHHCSTCGRCVIRMDHHCPWVNNCVAIFNQKYFILFLFYTALCCIYSGVLLVARFISCTHNLRQCSVSGGQAAMCVINFVEALVFGLFVIIMMFDQFSAIFDSGDPNSHYTHIKGTKKRSKYDSMKAVFGEPFSYRWFLPLNPTPKLQADFIEECREAATSWEDTYKQLQQAAAEQAAAQVKAQTQQAADGEPPQEQTTNPHKLE
eukprot:CAMPEP_0175131226 /NCGR_PEP_ID=MMETSP0087-20121206/6427_1 /TAXON_ID=136419 /ORGANISM="Unknown Unknown, Strain D1" /LENGTH=310 /DNA_ID=CAMNT_0016413497 /DNA_START=16 /DNA_END=948 /DNA_ORIENTATION=-